MNKLKVLIVDDEQDLVSTLGERLEMRGIQTQVCTDGICALDIMKKNPPNVVVLDVIMPGMSGLEVLDVMNSMNIKIPVVLLTGYGSKKKGEEGIKKGAYDYLMKPMDIDELISVMKEAINSNDPQENGN